jgi:quercetin dioxygenase-like cupin family protein
MKLLNLKDMTRGWLIGDFEPSILRTQGFEVGVLTHKKGEEWAEHYHKIATEYNVLIKGKMTLNGILINEGDIFILIPNETALPEFLEDCTVLCVKVPSVIGDKYAVNK